MAYDGELANRLRELLAGVPAITEKQMFGGLAFLLDGNMALAASGRGGLLVRVDPEQTDSLIAAPDVARMQMGGREMDGWVTVALEGVATDSELAAWVERGVTFARSLPAKEPKPRR